MLLDAPLILFVILAAILGLIAGSFLSTLVLRWPQGQDLSGRSKCDGCSRTLGWQDLIPLVSYIWFRGKCRTCGHIIETKHLVFELACAMIGIVAILAQPSFAGLSGALFGWILLALMALDLDYRWLPDKLVYPLLILGIFLGLNDFSDRLTGATLAAAFSLLLYFGYKQLRGHEGMGLGDVKLLAALGAWLGPWNLAPLLLLSALLGIVFAIKLKHSPPRANATVEVPFGACLAVAAFALWVLASTKDGLPILLWG